MNKLITSILVVLFINVSAQEGVAPLLGNELLQIESQKKQNFKTGDDYSYEFKFDTNHLPILDDFATNRFKKYTFDTANTLTDTLIWQNFLVDGVYQKTFQAMTDTSYYFWIDSTDINNPFWDSVKTPEVYITHLSRTDYQMVVDTDTVWARQDTLVINDVVFTNHPPNRDYINFSDTVVIVPDLGEGTSIWRNNNALHNYTYSEDPVTLGMATFDGLDSTGVPYDPTMNPNSYQVADILESKPIFLKSRPNGSDYNYLFDTIYLSFQYQPQGLGDQPETEDSLVLEFYSPFTDKWNNVWSVAGGPVHPFKNVLIRIQNPIYFLDGFKFRFKNYASVSGNFDHWNVDYVRLDEDRDEFDSTFTDVGLIHPGYSLLQDYYQMPWSHYKNATTNLMKTEQLIEYRNLGDISHLASSWFNVFEDGNLAPIFSSDTAIDPQFGALQKGGQISRFSEEYPRTSSDSIKSFEVQYRVRVSPDSNELNDTAFFHQQFGTQYAYDDGSAESAYFVTSAGAQIAVEYNVPVIDSLRAINIYFPRSYESIIDRAFRLKVWKSISPEVLLYESFLQYPVYAGGRDLVQGFKLEEPIEVEGQIFVGIEQLDKRVFIGLDKNMDSQSKNFYNVGNSWYNSSYEGSLFIRPEFGNETNPFPVSVDQVDDYTSDFQMYPNPANTKVNLEFYSSNNEVILTSMLGIEVMRFNCGYYSTLNVADLPVGLYVVQVKNLETKVSSIKKLLIQH